MHCGGADRCGLHTKDNITLTYRAISSTMTGLLEMISGISIGVSIMVKMDPQVC